MTDFKAVCGEEIADNNNQLPDSQEAITSMHKLMDDGQVKKYTEMLCPQWFEIEETS